MLNSSAVPLTLLATIALAAQTRPAMEIDPSQALTTASRSIRLSGKLAGGEGRQWKRVTWRKDTSAGGRIAPAAHWETDPIPLEPGDNHIVLTATDATGHSEQTGVHVFRTSADPLPESSGVLDWNGKTVRYQVYGGLLVADGCIELGSADVLLGQRKASGSREAMANPLAGQRWTGNTIPYVLDSGLTPAQRTLFERAVAHWESRTPIRFVVRSGQANFIRVTRTDNLINTAGGTGMVGGEQIMRMREDASFAIQVHEIGHTVGLQHEQNRADRNRYVTIDLNQVRKDEIQQMEAANGQLIGSYDMQSVMHYDKTFVNRFGLRNLETIPAGLDVYNDEGLSAADVDAVFRMYGQPRTRTTLATSPAGLNLIVDGETVTAPATFEWAVGSRHTIEAPASQGSGATVDRFARWANDGERVQTVIASADVTVYTANFVRHCRLTLRTPLDPSLGSYTITPFSADGYYPCDGEVTLTAFPAEGVKFLDWTGLVGATNPRKFRVNQAFLIRPTFTRGQTITFRTEPPGQLVRVNGANYFTPRAFAARDGNVFNVEGLTLNLSTLRYRFQKWSQGGNASQAIRIAGAESPEYTLTYEPMYYASARPIPAAGGTVTLTPPATDGFYVSGTSVEFRATPAANRTFRAWDGDLKGVAGTPASIRVDEPRYVEASFRDLGSPTITAISPERVVAGSLPPLLFVSGNGFVEALTQVFVNGQRREVTILGFNDLTIPLTAADLRTAGTLTIRVTNPGRADVADGSRPFTITAAPAGCTYSLGSTSVAAQASFATNSISVTAGNGCPWYPVTSDGWISVAGNATGAGNGALSIWTEPNPTPQVRRGQVQVAGQMIDVIQEGAPCEFAATPVSAIPSAGGTAPLFVRVFSTGCEWSLEGGSDWLTIGDTAQGAGNANLILTAAENSGAPRDTVLRIGRTSFAIRQDGVLGAVVNEANGLAALAPGSRFTITGENLAEASGEAEGVWPAQLNGVRVIFGDSPAPLKSVSGTRITGQVPSNVSGEVSVRVMRGETEVLSRQVTITETAPAVYAATELTAPAGGVITLRLTGVGAASPAIVDGEPAPVDPVAAPLAAITATIGGVEATVESVRMLPGEVGIAELRLRLPADLGPSDKSLVVRVGAMVSSPRVIQVQ